MLPWVFPVALSNFRDSEVEAYLCQRIYCSYTRITGIVSITPVLHVLSKVLRATLQHTGVSRTIYERPQVYVYVHHEPPAKHVDIEKHARITHVYRTYML